jgi:ribosomal 50S subunit-recycling heat shock protein
MGFLQDSTVEVTYNGKTTRVAKQDAHLYEAKEKPAKKDKETKTEK